MLISQETANKLYASLILFEAACLFFLRVFFYVFRLNFRIESNVCYRALLLIGVCEEKTMERKRKINEIKISGYIKKCRTDINVY